MNTIKRISARMLALSLAFLLVLPMGVSAAYEAIDGTPGNAMESLLEVIANKDSNLTTQNGAEITVQLPAATTVGQITFAAYRVINITFDQTTGTVQSYELNKDFQAAWDVLGVDSVEALGEKYGKSDLTAEEILEAIAKCLKDSIITPASTQTTNTVDGNKVATFSGLNITCGLYFIVPTVGSFTKASPLLVTVPYRNPADQIWYNTITVKAKSELPAVKKEASLTGADGSWNETMVQIGQNGKVYYKITVDVPKYAPTTQFKDSDLIAVFRDTMDTGITINYDTIKVSGKAGADVPVDLTNTDTVTNYTQTTKAADAMLACSFELEFTGYYANIKTYDQLVITYEASVNSDAAGIITNNAEFTYSIDPEDVEHTNTPEDSVDVKVAFTPLPSTGGMGTLLFAVGGLSLMALAVFVFIRTRKPNSSPK